MSFDDSFQIYKTMKLKSENKDLRGGEIILPFVGITKVDEEGCVEVDEKTSAFLIENTVTWKKVEADATVDSEELMKKLLKTKNEELYVMAEELEIENFKDLKKIDLVKLLVNKLSE